MISWCCQIKLVVCGMIVPRCFGVWSHQRQQYSPLDVGDNLHYTPNPLKALNSSSLGPSTILKPETLSPIRTVPSLNIGEAAKYSYSYFVHFLLRIIMLVTITIITILSFLGMYVCMYVLMLVLWIIITILHITILICFFTITPTADGQNPALPIIRNIP